nr:unnamed protein product [Callosobruchus chinensis]
MGVSIKNLKITKAGALLLIIERKGMAEALGEAIKKQVADSEVVIRSDQKTLIITDIDAVTTKEEVAAALQRLVNPNTEGSLTVGDLRPAKNGNQSATVIASKAVADLLIQLGSARIGLISCRVRERIRVQRCLR